VIKSCDHQSSSLFFEKADGCVRGLFRVLVRTWCCWVLVRTCSLRCGLDEPVGLWCVRDLGVRGLVGVAAPRRDPVGSCIVEILRVSKAGM